MFQDKERFKWYKKAAAQGHKAAQYSLWQCYDDGVGTEKDPEKCAIWFRHAASQDY